MHLHSVYQRSCGNAPEKPWQFQVLEANNLWNETTKEKMSAMVEILSFFMHTKSYLYITVESFSSALKKVSLENMRAVIF
jgi:hypothetical protein